MMADHILITWTDIKRDHSAVKRLCIRFGFTVIVACVRVYGDDIELRNLGITDRPCLSQPSGTAKTPDGIERNAMKNRSPVDLSTAKVEALDTAGFLKKAAAYDAQLNANR